MESIEQHIEKDTDELADPTISSQRRRHVESELEQLKAYHANHPEDHHDPSALELFCDSNPGAVECKIYEE